jgi:hypothetical protein
VGKGRTGSKVKLTERFEQAIDRCAMKVGLKDADAYLGEWRKAAPFTVEGEPDAVAASEAAKIEATIQTVMMAQELYAKAALVDHQALRRAQDRHDVVAAELELRKAFFTDVNPALQAWRRAQGLAADPLTAHRKSGYEKAAARDRSRRRRELGTAKAGSFA